MDLVFRLLKQGAGAGRSGFADDFSIAHGWQRLVCPAEQLGSNRAQPKTGVSDKSGDKWLAMASKLVRPGLSPACPREIVMPPPNWRWPLLSYSSVSPDVL